MAHANLPHRSASDVIYCSYGSNLAHKRFSAYIDGGTVPFNSVCFRGCSDKTPPRDSFVARVPYRLVFACDGTNWGGGGVAFLDPHRLPHDDSAAWGAIVRCYRISFEQWRDVVSQENRCEDLSGVLTQHSIEHLRARGPGATLELHERSWYSRLVYLGDAVPCGAPMLTFTCPMGLFAEPGHGLNPPRIPYASTLVAGLIEAAGMSPAEAVEYVRAAAEGPGRGAGTVAAGRDGWMRSEGEVADLAAAVELWLEPASPGVRLVQEWAAAVRVVAHHGPAALIEALRSLGHWCACKRQ